jgi:hypothetical protein
LHYILVFLQFREKIVPFVIDVKKQNMSHNFFSFSTKFCLFYAPRMTSRFFMKRLFAHVACEDLHVREFFFWNILTFQNVSKFAFQNREHMHPRAKTSVPFSKT